MCTCRSFLVCETTNRLSLNKFSPCGGIIHHQNHNLSLEAIETQFSIEKTKQDTASPEGLVFNHLQLPTQLQPVSKLHFIWQEEDALFRLSAKSQISNQETDFQQFGDLLFAYYIYGGYSLTLYNCFMRVCARRHIHLVTLLT